MPYEQIVSVNFEELEYEELLDYKKLYAYLKDRLVKDRITYIFLDEIQKVRDFEKVVDSLYVKSDVDIYITGSNTKIQGLLNHSDQRVTMRYLGTYREMLDRARIAVSDFVLGRSGVNVLIAGDRYTVDDVMDRLDVLEDHLTNEKEDQ